MYKVRKKNKERFTLIHSGSCELGRSRTPTPTATSSLTSSTSTTDFMSGTKSQAKYERFVLDQSILKWASPCLAGGWAGGRPGRAEDQHRLSTSLKSSQVQIPSIPPISINNTSKANFEPRPSRPSSSLTRLSGSRPGSSAMTRYLRA